MPISNNKHVYLDSIHIDDYKSIDNVTINFKRDLNIIIGRNGAGKSNLLRVLNDSLIPTRTRKFLFKSVTATFSTEDFQNKIEVEIVKNKRVVLKNDDIDDVPEFSKKITIDEIVTYDNSPSGSEVKDVSLSSTMRGAFRRFNIRYDSPIYLRYAIPDDVECVSEPGQIEIPLDDPEMIETPHSISVVIDAFERFEELIVDRRLDPLSIDKTSILDAVIADERLLANLSKFTPIKGFKLNENINIYNDGKAIIAENIRFDFLVDGKWMPWSYLSDGTRRLFYLVSEISAANNRLILIEEPELGVHPHQFNLLMHFLKEQSSYNQIIMSTHSPLALNHLDEDELDKVLIAFIDDRGTQLRRLNQAEREKAIAYMNEVGSLSDYWLMSDLEE